MTWRSTPSIRVAHRHPALLRLDVDVARSRQDPLGDDQVHEPHHRALARLGLGSDELVGRHVLQVLQRGRGLHPLEQLVDGLLGTVQLVQPLRDLGRREQKHPDLTGGGECEGLLRVEVERVRRRHLKVGVRGAERQDVVAARHLLGDPLLGGRVELRQVRELQPEAGGQSREDLLVARDLLGDQRLPQPRRWWSLLPQLHQELRRDDVPEGVRQPFIREVCVGHSVSLR